VHDGPVLPVFKFIIGRFAIMPDLPPKA